MRVPGLIPVAAIGLGSATSGFAQQSHLVVIAGLGGEPRYEQSFHSSASAMTDSARERFGLPDSAVIYLAPTPARDPQRITGRSTKENVEAVLERLAATTGPSDRVFIFLIGHGTQRGDRSRFNLPGPDITDADFARLLRRFPTQRIVFVNSASASGDFIPSLSGPNRTVVTATRSGSQRNETVFAEFFVRAFAGDGADADKDKRVSVLEAFEYAQREVRRHYESQDLLVTEHAMLDDNGDGVGSRTPDPRAGDGALAKTLFLSEGLRERIRPENPAVAALYRERLDLESRVEALKLQKESMESGLYAEELEALLVELALKSRAIREAEAGGR